MSFIANKFRLLSLGFCCLPPLGLSDTLAFIYNPISLRWNAFVTGSWSSASHRIDNLWPHKNHKAARVETLWRCWLKIETGQGTRQCCPYPFYLPLSPPSEKRPSTCTCCAMGAISSARIYHVCLAMAKLQIEFYVL